MTALDTLAFSFMAGTCLVLAVMLMVFVCGIVVLTLKGAIDQTFQ